jgi:predicted nucleic acid-binding protein
MSFSGPDVHPAIIFALVCLASLSASESFYSKPNPRLYVKGESGFRVVGFTVLATAICYAVIRKKEDFIAAMLIAPFTLPFADILWIEARANLRERRGGVGLALLLVSGIALVIPAMLTFFV